MQLYMLFSCLVLLLTVLLNMSVSVSGQGARSKLATINDLVAKATKKIDKAFINKKIEEKKKTPQKGNDLILFFLLIFFNSIFFFNHFLLLFSFHFL